MNRRLKHRRSGFTMVELFAVVLLITIMTALLLPAVQSARENARRTSCANNLMQVSLAVSGYHAAFDQLPVQLSGTDGNAEPKLDNDRRLSFLVGILPFCERRVLAEQIRTSLPRSLEDEFESMDGMFDDAGAFHSAEDELENLAEVEETVAFWVVGGPEPFVGSYSPWRIDVPVFRCPSDPGIGNVFGRTNYAACLGDAVLGADSGPLKADAQGRFVEDAELARQTEAAMRGAFVPRVVTRWSDILDGRSNTLLLGEMATDLGDRDIRTYPAAAAEPSVLRDQPMWARSNQLIDEERIGFWNISDWDENNVGRRLESDATQRRGLRWADGMPLYTGFNTILSPNREITLSVDRDDTWGILPPSSRHQGGVQVALADGSVRFVSDSVDAGDSSQPTVYDGSANQPGSKSPYGVWGAMGTRASGELSRL